MGAKTGRRDTGGFALYERTGGGLRKWKSENGKGGCGGRGGRHESTLEPTALWPGTEESQASSGSMAEEIENGEGHHSNEANHDGKCGEATEHSPVRRVPVDNRQID